MSKAAFWWKTAGSQMWARACSTMPNLAIRKSSIAMDWFSRPA